MGFLVWLRLSTSRYSENRERVFPLTRPCDEPSGRANDHDATTALPTGSSVNDGGVGWSSSMSRADRQWNNWDGGAAASMGDCKSAGSLFPKQPGPAPWPEMKDLDSHQDIRVYTHNDTDTGYAERRDTRQSAARPCRAPQDQPCARAMLKKGNGVTKEQNTRSG